MVKYNNTNNSNESIDTNRHFKWKLKAKSLVILVNSVAFSLCLSNSGRIVMPIAVRLTNSAFDIMSDHYLWKVKKCTLSQNLYEGNAFKEFRIRLSCNRPKKKLSARIELAQ